MRKLLHCRRGTVAFATVVALVPLIGAVSLGAEAASWYVTKQRAQNAADAAAYSGAVQQACLAASSCSATNTVDYRGKEFAAQNGFCNTGDISYPGAQCPTGISQTVTIASLTSWNGANGNFVQATVSQTEPTYLAAVLGLSTVSIHATAVAKVQGLLHPPCVLALTGSISFQGAPTIDAPNCGMASNDPAANALNFTGGGMTMNLGSLSAVGGCTGAASFCKTAFTYMPAPIVDPFSVLDNVTLPTLPDCTLPAPDVNGVIKLVAYSAATPCANNLSKLKGGSTGVSMNGGVYFISGSKLKGSQSISGTGLLIPLGSINLKGSSSINVTGNASVTAAQLPPALQPYASLFANMAIYDRYSTAWSIGGNSSVTFQGNMYLPNAAVTFQGNPTVSTGSGQCGELIAASIAFNGHATFDSTGCSSATKLPTTQYVQLVQ